MHRNPHLKKEMVYALGVLTAEPGEHKNFFEEVTHFLGNMVNIYDCIMSIGDLNINLKFSSDKLDHLTELCDVFDLSKLTCTTP